MDKENNFGRRIKILQVDPQLILEIINWCRNPPDWLVLPITEEIPEDAVVVSVSNNWANRTMEFQIHHPSFDFVPAGQVPPTIPNACHEWRRIDVKPKQEDDEADTVTWRDKDPLI